MSNSAPDTAREWARRVFPDVWRTSSGRPGFAVRSFSNPQPSSLGLRRFVAEVVAEFTALAPRPFVVERVGRFDQQVSTRFHRDGAADASLLILAYEPTTVASQLFLCDPFRAAESGSAFDYLKRHKTMTKDGDDELMRHAVSVLEDSARAHVVAINNCAVLADPPVNHPLGLLHKGLIPVADPTARRVINSLGLMYEGEPHREPVSAERWAWFLTGNTTE